MESIEIVVISLSRATERRNSIEKQFLDLDLPFAFFDAVDGIQGHELFSRYDADNARRIGEIPLTAGHLGCYASHFLAWQHCIDLGKPMVILEDDAIIFPDPFLNFVRKTPDLPKDIECVRLFKNKSRKKNSLKVFSDKNIAIAKFMRGHKSATGYYLTPTAARKFLDHAQRWTEPVDIEMDQFWANGVECYGVTDPCLTHHPAFESSIDFGVDTSRERRGLMRLRWRWYLLKGKLRREHHNVLFKAKYRKTFRS